MKQKLSESQVNEIKELYSKGVKVNDLAIKFKVTQPTISYHINPELNKRSRENSVKWFQNLSKERKSQIYAKRREYLKIYMRTYKKSNSTKSVEQQKEVKGGKNDKRN